MLYKKPGTNKYKYDPECGMTVDEFINFLNEKINKLEKENSGFVLTKDFGTYLKDCPFCGSKAMLHRYKRSGTNFDEIDINCVNCDCELTGDVEEELIKRWNTRYHDTEDF